MGAPRVDGSHPADPAFVAVEDNETDGGVAGREVFHAHSVGGRLYPERSRSLTGAPIVRIKAGADRHHGLPRAVTGRDAGRDQDLLLLRAGNRAAGARGSRAAVVVAEYVVPDVAGIDGFVALIQRDGGALGGNSLGIGKGEARLAPAESRCPRGIVLVPTGVAPGQAELRVLPVAVGVSRPQQERAVGTLAANRDAVLQDD